jgi:hypothetical protein
MPKLAEVGNIQLQLYVCAFFQNSFSAFAQIESDAGKTHTTAQTTQLLFASDKYQKTTKIHPKGEYS